MENPIQLNTSRQPGAKAMKALLEELRIEDAGMENWLVDAASAGLALTSHPSDRGRRATAALAWKTMSPILSHHLTSEDETVLPWADLQRGASHALINRLKEQHQKLRALVKVINGVAFEHDPDGRVATAGKALCDFAVCLDDVIAGEQRDLFPMLRRILFRPNHR